MVFFPYIPLHWIIVCSCCLNYSYRSKYFRSTTTGEHYTIEVWDVHLVAFVTFYFLMIKIKYSVICLIAAFHFAVWKSGREWWGKSDYNANVFKSFHKIIRKLRFLEMIRKTFLVKMFSALIIVLNLRNQFKSHHNRVSVQYYTMYSLNECCITLVFPGCFCCLTVPRRIFSTEG